MNNSSKNQEFQYTKKPTFFNVFCFILLITFISFGGGNALMPTIKKYAVDKYKWLSPDEFEQNVIITNMLPGPSVIEAMSYIAIKLLGFKKGMFLVILAALPHLLVFFLIFYFVSYIPQKYLFVIELGVIVAIIGSLIGFALEYYKKGRSKLKVSLWFFLFLVTFAFCFFIPSPWNMPVIIMLLIASIFASIEVIKHKKEIKKLAIEQENKNELNKTKKDESEQNNNNSGEQKGGQ
ncbi:chromate transporter [Mycoplasmopsis caviae]|uniref:Chromate transporter n=1 Tax=Mycoplasmopsis caviae TaxID=55603 RepID=A0A3P8KM00_9BACT|nr:chromate transporter [Mycoplasmopsis caviae]UUD35425.1 chromate transporter [Mycoplasmopsis caviae]VDR41798.1 chromate transporter [Mycoplasmopsis caviae]